MALSERVAKGGENIKTSVIIPVYNTEDYLAECVDSILAQTQRETEIILVDDGSTDGSLAIERAYAEADPRVVVITQPNLRQGAARNAGLRVARGEYVYFMDSDDYIVPEHFDTCYEACERDGLDFVCFDTAGFADDPTVERPDLFPEIGQRAGISREDICDGPTFWSENMSQGRLLFVCWLQYFRRDFLLSNDLFFTEGIYFEDNDWFLRVYLAAQRLRYMPLKLHRYRDRPGSNVHSGFKQVLAESCFEIHDLVLPLREAQTDPVRAAMVDNVGHVLNMRFAQFGELEPNEAFVSRTLAYAHDLFARASDPAASDAAVRWHLETFLALCGGMGDWPGCKVPVPRGQLMRVLFGAEPTLDGSVALGIYGTGAVCRSLLQLLDVTDLPVTFLVSSAPSTSVFEGKPLMAVGDAGGLGIGEVLVASTRYQDQMVRAAHDALGDDVRVLCISRAILAFDSKALRVIEVE